MRPPRSRGGVRGALVLAMDLGFASRSARGTDPELDWAWGFVSLPWGILEGGERERLRLAVDEALASRRFIFLRSCLPKREISAFASLTIFIGSMLGRRMPIMLPLLLLLLAAGAPGPGGARWSKCAGGAACGWCGFARGIPRSASPTVPRAGFDMSCSCCRAGGFDCAAAGHCCPSGAARFFPAGGVIAMGGAAMGSLDRSGCAACGAHHVGGWGCAAGEPSREGGSERWEGPGSSTAGMPWMATGVATELM